jgi:hypothetical protein
MKSMTGALLASVLMFVPMVSAQWLDRPTPGIPRTRDGKPNLLARAPRRDGHMDLSGVWRPDLDPQVKGTNQELLPRYFLDITTDLKPENVPLRAETAALFKERSANNGKDDPISHCHPVGVPAIDTVPLPYKIIQMPGLTVILYEGDTTFRQIFTDGRTLPQNPMPSWMGYSVGRWEGETLVVDTVGLNDRSWLDRVGHPHSEGLHVIERFRRRDFGHMEIQVTIDDPQSYTAPFTFTQAQTLLPDTDLLEYFCTDNEQDAAHFK